MRNTTHSTETFGRIERRDWCVVTSDHGYQAKNPMPEGALDQQ